MPFTSPMPSTSPCPLPAPCPLLAHALLLTYRVPTRQVPSLNLLKTKSRQARHGSARWQPWRRRSKGGGDNGSVGPWSGGAGRRESGDGRGHRATRALIATTGHCPPGLTCCPTCWPDESAAWPPPPAGHAPDHRGPTKGQQPKWPALLTLYRNHPTTKRWLPSPCHNLYLLRPLQRGKGRQPMQLMLQNTGFQGVFNWETGIQRLIMNLLMVREGKKLRKHVVCSFIYWVYYTGRSCMQYQSIAVISREGIILHINDPTSLPMWYHLRFPFFAQVCANKINNITGPVDYIT